ncbi:SNF2 family N-terminal domain-containing protein [Exophiala viscosa]|uniref:SNF2 family N-terminal domain-containing protein n=1 Tax=Exophiala viscosa TaxID=2486360 RepID=UPI0021A0ADD3|nr:SNF2 family N-terminal domain-containing protein [Exophiala viscosa]
MKRTWDAFGHDEPESSVARRSIEGPGNTDGLSMPSDEIQSWSEMLTSVLGVKDTSSDDDHEAFPEGLTQKGGVLSNVDYVSESTLEQSALAHVGRQIEAWAETAVSSLQSDQDIGLEPPSKTSQMPHSMTEDIQCFGMIHGCETRLVNSMQDLSVRLGRMPSDDRWVTFHILFGQTIVHLVLEGYNEQPFGQVRDGLYNPLSAIYKLTGVSPIAYVPKEDCLRVINRAKKQRDAEVNVDINVYGPASACSEVGRILSLERLYLQHPRHRHAGFSYQNPHMLAYNDIQVPEQSDDRLSEASQNGAVRNVQQIILDVCSAETQDHDYQVDIDDVLSNTRLFPHQATAVQFMIERELGPIPEDRKLWQYKVEENRVRFQHAVTGSWTAVAPSEIGGGIIADDMGMGKTLNVLSVVAKTLPEARNWAQTDKEGPGDLEGRTMRSRTTLVVVPSLLIMNGWQEEIETKLNTSLNYCRYHGRGRRFHRQSILDTDIILTTYHTLAAERKSKKHPLRSIKWFRIVLDEAHTIRRQATGLYHAVVELGARYRWCLTGTPIQNTLDDLGALLAFIRAEPFHNSSVFRRFVVMPFSHNNEEDVNQAKAKLSLLLNSVCIRRRRERLELPPMKDERRNVQLSDQERRLYERTKDSMSYMLSHGLRDKYSGTPFGKFQIQLQLRRLCNHGTFQRPFVGHNDDIQTQREEILSSIGKDGEVECSSCHEKTLMLATNWAAVRQNPSCNHNFCDECLAQLSDQGQEALRASVCPYCANQESSTPYSSILKRGAFPHPTPGFLTMGHSSKMEALVRDVQERIQETKSIVFSTWTRSLDLVELHLKKERILFTRIDGATEPNKRQKILNEFAKSKKVRVLLMTTGTGAYGLNLTVANRIFILEPQWNPSIEDQAIARAQRLLQEHSVHVIRYVVRGTVEEDIKKQQQSKIDVAEMGFRGL